MKEHIEDKVIAPQKSKAVGEAYVPTVLTPAKKSVLAGVAMGMLVGLGYHVDKLDRLSDKIADSEAQSVEYASDTERFRESGEYSEAELYVLNFRSEA